MPTYRTWADGLPPEDIDAVSGFEARKTFAFKHHRRANECMARVKPEQLTREDFAKISEVEGLPPDQVKEFFEDFDRRNLSPEERRQEIIKRFKPR